MTNLIAASTTPATLAARFAWTAHPGRATATLAALTAAATLGAAALGCTSPSWPASPTAATELARFDAAQGGLAEGLAVRGKTAYVGFASTGQVVAVDLGTGKTAPYSSLPAPVAGKGFVTGRVLRGDD